MFSAFVSQSSSQNGTQSFAITKPDCDLSNDKIFCFFFPFATEGESSLEAKDMIYKPV